MPFSTQKYLWKVLFMIKSLKTLSAKNRDFAKNRKKIVKNLVESLKTKLSLNDSSKIS